jgi:hypothetical protein
MKSEVRYGIGFAPALLWWEDTLADIVAKYEAGVMNNIRVFEVDTEVLLGYTIKTEMERFNLGLDNDVSEVWISLKKDNTPNDDILYNI